MDSCKSRNLEIRLIPKISLLILSFISILQASILSFQRDLVLLCLILIFRYLLAHMCTVPIGTPVGMYIYIYLCIGI